MLARVLLCVADEVLLADGHHHRRERHGLQGRRLRTHGARERVLLGGANRQRHGLALVQHVQREEHRLSHLQLRPAPCCAHESRLDQNAAGDAQGRPDASAVLAHTRGGEVADVRARAVADEEHPGDVGGLTEELTCLVTKSSVLRQRDAAEPADRGDGRVDVRWQASLGRERELDRDDHGRDGARETRVELVVHEPGRVGEAEAAAVEVHDDGQAPALAVVVDLGEVDPEIGLPWEVVQRVPVAGHVVRRHGLHHREDLGWAGPRAVDAAVVQNAQPAGHLVHHLAATRRLNLRLQLGDSGIGHHCCHRPAIGATTRARAALYEGGGDGCGMAGGAELPALYRQAGKRQRRGQSFQAD
uniref:Uncharacterized protein n=1 Tax=Zea mays TaxID=4577 RepID=A0A804Q2F6_MAIZE